MKSRHKNAISNKMYKEIAMILLTTVIMVLSCYAYFTRSLAWFTLNETIDATGMKVKCDSVASLIITNTLNEGDPDFSGMGYDVEFESTSTILCAATRVNASDTTLKYVSYSDVTPETGVAFTDAAYLDAVKDKQYVEYISYFGSTDKALMCSSVTAEITSGVITEEFQKAISIDILVDDVYSGTLRLNDTTQTVDLDITSIDTNDPPKITLWCYFDGALTDSNGKAYLRSGTVDTTDINIGITFTANNPHSAS